MSHSSALLNVSMCHKHYPVKRHCAVSLNHKCYPVFWHSQSQTLSCLMIQSSTHIILFYDPVSHKILYWLMTLSVMNTTLIYDIVIRHHQPQSLSCLVAQPQNTIQSYDPVTKHSPVSWHCHKTQSQNTILSYDPIKKKLFCLWPSHKILSCIMTSVTHTILFYNIVSNTHYPVLWHSQKHYPVSCHSQSQTLSCLMTQSQSTILSSDTVSHKHYPVLWHCHKTLSSYDTVSHKHYPVLWHSHKHYPVSWHSQSQTPSCLTTQSVTNTILLWHSHRHYPVSNNHYPLLWNHQSQSLACLMTLSVSITELVILWQCQSLKYLVCWCPQPAVTASCWKFPTHSHKTILTYDIVVHILMMPSATKTPSLTITIYHTTVSSCDSCTKTDDVISQLFFVMSFLSTNPSSNMTLLILAPSEHNPWVLLHSTHIAVNQKDCCSHSDVTVYSLISLILCCSLSQHAWVTSGLFSISNIRILFLFCFPSAT